MRSRQLETSLTEFFGAASAYLRAEVAAGAEVPFELGTQTTRRGRTGTPLYTYRALTGQFIAERERRSNACPAMPRRPSCSSASTGSTATWRASAARPRAPRVAHAPRRAQALLDDVFDEQTDFELRPERLQAALTRLQDSTLANAGELTLVATLHGVTIASAELQLTKGLRIAQRDALAELPDAAPAARGRARREPPDRALYDRAGRSRRGAARRSRRAEGPARLRCACSATGA